MAMPLKVYDGDDLIAIRCYMTILRFVQIAL